MKNINDIIENALALAGYDMYQDERGHMTAYDKEADKHYHIAVKCDEEPHHSKQMCEGVAGAGFYVPPCAAKWMAPAIKAHLLKNATQFLGYAECTECIVWRVGLDYDVVYLTINYNDPAKTKPDSDISPITIAITDTLDGNESVDFAYCDLDHFEETLRDVLAGTVKSVEAYVESAGMDKDSFQPGFEALQVCESCGKEFLTRYNKWWGYEYASEPCDCENHFHPAEGVPSLSEWQEALSAEPEASSKSKKPIPKEVDGYRIAYHCNCCGCEFDHSECLNEVTTQDDIECPDCGCQYHTGHIERFSKPVVKADDAGNGEPPKEG